MATVAAAMTKVQHDLGWTESDVAASHKRVAPVWACLLPDIGADWGIENIATKPQHRHRGLASMLLNEIVQNGRERGCKLAQITTFVGHGDAERLYKKAGFKVSDEKRCSEMASVLNTPGFVRFTRELERAISRQQMAGDVCPALAQKNLKAQPSHTGDKAICFQEAPTE